MVNYQPNFDDPRVNKRIKKALGFACGVLSETKSHAWSTRYIDKYFGSQRNDLSKFLRKVLLIETKSQWNKDTGECKEYILNNIGVRYLRESLNLNNIQIYPIVVDLAKVEHKDELVTGEFTYNDKSNRLWHPLQRYRKAYKTQVLNDSGYVHHYDIECCAPTLIYQYAQQLGMDEYPFAIKKYITDRTAVRQELAMAVDLPTEAIKEIINALFAGASIGHNTQSDIYHILNGDRARIEYLKQDQFLSELREEIKTCWEYIRPVMQKRTKLMSNGKERLLKITSRQKWNVYFEQERRVLNSVRTYLDDKTFRYFCEHDGWSCDNEIDICEIIDYVRCQTGFDIKLEHENLTYNNIPYCSGSLVKQGKE